METTTMPLNTPETKTVTPRPRVAPELGALSLVGYSDEEEIIKEPQQAAGMPCPALDGSVRCHNPECILNGCIKQRQ